MSAHASGPTPRYRADIDGLRCIAITSVVAYHVGLPGIGAGFVGVDVFFVISGYLITGLLARELDTTGRLDLAVAAPELTDAPMPGVGRPLASPHLSLEFSGWEGR